MVKEDIYSIVDTCFMPSGIECDQYSVVGEIRDIDLKKNRITGEEIYDMNLECNDLFFRVAINKMDLLGEPSPGLFDLYRTHINIEILFIRNYYSIFMVLLRTLRSIFCISYTTLGCCNMILARSFMSFLIS